MVKSFAMQTHATSPANDDPTPALAAIVGAAHALTTPADMAAFLTEERGLYRGAARCVVQPGSTREVSEILKLASARRLKIVPQGGNTGLVGGQTPSARGDEIVLSLRRMNAVREVDVAARLLDDASPVARAVVKHHVHRFA